MRGIVGKKILMGLFMKHWEQECIGVAWLYSEGGPCSFGSSPKKSFPVGLRDGVVIIKGLSPCGVVLRCGADAPYEYASRVPCAAPPEPP